MIERKFTKVGRSRAIIIPPLFLKLLKINPDLDKVNVNIEGEKIIIEKKKD